MMAIIGFGAAAVIAICMVILQVFQTQAFHSTDEGKASGTSIVARGSVEDTVAAMGRLQPVRGVDVGTQISGQLKALYVAIGDEVQAGQLVAEIDPAPYQARVDASRANIAILKAQLDDKRAQLRLARAEFERKASLARNSFANQSELETREAALKSATAVVIATQAEIQRAEAQLRTDEINLQHTRIYAPMNGTVTSQSAYAGQILTAIQDTPVIVGIADLKEMTIEAYVSEADIGKLYLGAKAYFLRIGDLERRWHGRLRQINPKPEAINNVIQYKALFEVKNTDNTLKIGMTAQVFFILAEAKNVLTIPRAVECS